MDRYEREIVELHQFFVDWFKGDIPNDDATFARFADTMAPDFVIVTPSGQRVRRDAVLASVHAAHGKSTMIGITINAVRHHATHGDVHIIEYEEWQVADLHDPTIRLSTVVFKDDDSAPNGLQWLYVQETWKDGHAPA